MNTKPLLPLDTARCGGYFCDYKEHCLRYLARKDHPYVSTSSFGYFTADDPFKCKCDHAIAATSEQIAIAKERCAL